MRFAAIALLSLSALTSSDASNARAITEGTADRATIDVTVSGLGIVDLAGMACRDATCALFVPPSASIVRLIAEPDAGVAFLGWSGDCTGPTLLCEIAPAGDGAVTATFGSTVITLDATALADAKVADPYTGTLRLIGETGPAPVSWFLASGELPTGLALESPTGIITGIPEEPGEFTIALVARSDVFETRGDVSLTVVAPDLTMQDIIDHVTASRPADEVILRYLDGQGNLNGALDIGDIAAWLERNKTTALAPARVSATGARPR